MKDGIRSLEREKLRPNEQEAKANQEAKADQETKIDQEAKQINKEVESYFTIFLAIFYLPNPLLTQKPNQTVPQVKSSST
jgi:hypothetical protein